jgi:elongation factor G
MPQPKTKTDRQVSMEKVRNIGIIAHIDAGKTTTTERVLFYTGKTHKIGDIDEGTTITDWMDQERERGITIVSAAITTFWKEHRFNIIDTPGHVDFTAEVERSLRVLDGGIMVFDAEEGVQAQSETVWRQANKYFVPRLILINKMDKIGADFENTLSMIRDRLQATPVVITIPIGKEHAFKGCIDLLSQKMLIWDKDELGIEYSTQEVSDDFKPEVKKWRSILIEQICSEDEALLEKFLNDQEPSVEELKKVLRKATIERKLFPTYCGSSLRNKGVQPVLDGVVDFLPSPLDLPPVSGFDPQTEEKIERKPQNTQPLSALLFKVQTDPHVGKLSYLRVYSGILKSGSSVLNVTKQKTERIGRLLLMHADKREAIEQAYAGEIVACIGLKESSTGDTLCDPTNPISLENISFPDPVIHLSIEPATKDDQEKMGNALHRLSEEDPTFSIKVDHETGQTIISGMGELHLEILAERLKREFAVNATTGKPQVAYRETIKTEAQGEGKYIRQTGGRGQYGHCLLRVEPKTRGEGFEFASEIKGAAIPQNFIPSIEKGVKEALEKGVISPYPMVDLKVAVYDGSFHEVDSSDMAFKIAGSMALQDAVKKASPTLIEPIMKMEVTTPSEFLGAVMGDLSSRRAQILGTNDRNVYTLINASIPLSEARGYATVIRSLTQGRGSFYMEPSHYEEVPVNIMKDLVNPEK